jgi:hypothetical protein
MESPVPCRCTKVEDGKYFDWSVLHFRRSWTRRHMEMLVDGTLLKAEDKKRLEVMKT